MSKSSLVYGHYERLVQECEQLIEELEKSTKEYAEFVKSDGVDLFQSIKELENSPFARARNKAQNEQITVAVCGAFSSGKSFLISSLIDRLDWFPRDPTIDDLAFNGESLDGWSTFLPTAPEQTNSCPLIIVPSDIDQSRFEVKFKDFEGWEDRSKPYAGEDDISRKLLAYATDIDEWRSTRPSHDLRRTVTQARVFVGRMPLPAIIFDLPGIGGAGETYISTVQQCLWQADCIIYVSSARTELTEAELSLLRFVEDVSNQNRCPVFFVLSQIDRESQWRRVLEKNNKFLQEFFQHEGKPNKIFIGNGFTPLSPATEAKAKGLFEDGTITQAKRDDRIKQSGMEDFRKLIRDHLMSVSGPAHLREIALQLYVVQKALKSHISNRLHAEVVPLEDAAKSMKEANTLASTLREKRRAILSDITESGEAALLAAFSNTDADDLANELRKSLEPIIREDVTQEKIRHKYEQTKKEITDKWLRRPQVGLEDSWNRAWKDYQGQTFLSLHQRLNEAVTEAAVSSAGLIGILDNDSKDSPELESNLVETAKLVQMAMQVSLGVVGIGAIGASGIAASQIIIGGTTIALGPIGFFLLMSGGIGLALSFLKKSDDKKKLRKLMSEHISIYSERVVSGLKLQATQLMDKHKGEIVNIVNRLISEQEDRVSTLDNRLKTGDLVANAVRTELLRKYEASSTAIDQRLSDYIYKLSGAKD